MPTEDADPRTGRYVRLRRARAATTPSASPVRRRHFVASVAISIAVVLPLSGCDEAAKESAESYIAQAREYRDAGDPRSGIIQLKNAIRDYPENAEARALLGRIYLEIGNSPSASKELQRARPGS